MQSPSATQNYKTSVLIIVSVGGFLAPFMSSAINIALPEIGNEFSADAVTLSWVASSFLLATAVFLIPFGRISDLHGREKIYIAGAALYLIGSISSALAWSTAALLIFRVIQGISGAMIAANTGAIITAAFPPGERGRAMGISVAFVYFGISLGPFLGGFMTQYLGWRSLFWANSVVSLIMLALVVWKLKPQPAVAKGEKFDLTGSIIYAISLTAIMFGFTELPAPAGIASLVLGLAILIMFIKYEGRVEQPALDINLFRKNRVFAFSNVAALVNYGATFAVGFLLSFYLQYTKGLSPSNAGLVLVAMPAVQAVLSPVAGRLSDRIEPQFLATAGMAVTAAGLLILAFVGADTQLWYIVFGLVVVGCGFGLFSSTNINAVMSSVDAKALGIASATLSTMRMIGQVLSMSIATLLIGLFIGHVAVTPEYYPLFVRSQQIALVIFAVLAVGGVFASMARGKAPRPDVPID